MEACNYGSLTADDPKVDQHPDVKALKLKAHQRTLVRAMLELEERGYIRFRTKSHMKNFHVSFYDDHYAYNKHMYKEHDFTLETNYGLLADKVGSGKTVVAAMLPVFSRVPPAHDVVVSSSVYSVLKVRNTDQGIPTNMYVVPHNVFSQWLETFRLTNLKVCEVRRSAQVDALVFDENVFKTVPPAPDADYTEVNCLEHYDVVLVSSTMFDAFYFKFHNVKWGRIVIDEVVSIKLPTQIEWKCNFLWFITATPSAVRDIRRTYIRGLMCYMNPAVFNKLIIKNDDEYVDASMSLPDINQLVIRCLTPRELNLFRDYLSNDVIAMINAGNLQDAISRLNCNVERSDTIVEAITRRLQNDIHNHRIELEYQERRIPIDRRAHEEQLKKLRDALQSLEVKFTSIKARIEAIKTETCPICMVDYNNPSVTPCCNNVFCLECLLQCHGTCPMCRATLDMSTLIVVGNGEQPAAASQHKLRCKLDNLVSLLRSKRDGKFLVFSNFDRTFDNLAGRLTVEGITHSRVQGTGAAITNTIRRFETGEVNVLLLNAQYYGSGLNLQMATDIVIYHELDVELETQVIGRAQRLGRTTPLNVFYLQHEQEKINCKHPKLTLNLYDDDLSELEQLRDILPAPTESTQKSEDEPAPPAVRRVMRRRNPA